MATIYEQLGGEDAIHAAVVIFYGRVLSDRRVARFFAGLDMDQQIAKQRAFMTLAFGGPSTYSGRQMRAAHAPLVARGLSDEHFDAVVEHLGATLREMGVREALVAEVLDAVGATRADVLGR